jgi:hypothetical protein
MVGNEAQANGSDAGPQAKEYLRCGPSRAVAVDDLKLCGRVGAMYTCETGMKAAIMKSTEPTRRKAAATRSDLIEALVALPPACYRRGNRIAPLYHATRRTSAPLCLFTEVPRRENSRKFA